MESYRGSKKRQAGGARKGELIPLEIVTFSDVVTATIKKSSGSHGVVFEPGKSYVLALSQLKNLISVVSDRVSRASALDPRVENFNVRARKIGNQRVLIYNGASGYGDQIMTWPVGQALDQLGFEVHVLVDAGNETCWWGFPWVKAIWVLPIYFEKLKLFDYISLFDRVSNADEHADQLHPTDLMLRRIGIDPASVSANVRQTKPDFTERELRDAVQFVAGAEIAIYQLSAAGSARSLSPEDSAFMLRRLAERFNRWRWVALFDPMLPPSYRLKAEGLGMANIQVVTFAYIRQLWAVASLARVVVGPDSMMIHVAGVFGTPSVSLWGPTDPTSRLTHYDRAIHQSVWHKDQCQYAPCYYHGNTLPGFCPAVKSKLDRCLVLQAVGPDEVISQVELVTSRDSRAVERKDQAPVQVSAASPTPALSQTGTITDYGLIDTPEKAEAFARAQAFMAPQSK